MHVFLLLISAPAGSGGRLSQWALGGIIAGLLLFIFLGILAVVIHSWYKRRRKREYALKYGKETSKSIIFFFMKC